jgi:hypothetical protein
MKANLTHCLAEHVNMHERGLWLEKIITALSATIDPLDQFLNTLTLALPSAGAEGGLLCECACSPFPRRHAILTASQRNSSVYLIAISCLLHRKHRLKETGT